MRNSNDSSEPPCNAPQPAGETLPVVNDVEAVSHVWLIYFAVYYGISIGLYMTYLGWLASPDQESTYHFLNAHRYVKLVPSIIFSCLVFFPVTRLLVDRLSSCPTKDFHRYFVAWLTFYLIGAILWLCVGILGPRVGIVENTVLGTLITAGLIGIMQSFVYRYCALKLLLRKDVLEKH